MQQADKIFFEYKETLERIKALIMEYNFKSHYYRNGNVIEDIEKEIQAHDRRREKLEDDQ